MQNEQPISSRRELIRTTGLATIATLVAPTASALDPEHRIGRAGDPNQLPLGRRIRGFQHFGLTVQDMDRAATFYTEILGGTEIMRDGDFHGEAIHNTLLLNDELEAKALRIAPATIGVPDLRGGAQKLDVRFLQFDNMVLELLHYREASQPAGSGAAWAPPHTHRSPAYPGSLHLCFHLHDDVDFNRFIHDLETESARRGMTNVRANRTVTVLTEDGRKTAPLETMSNKITGGKSNGWALIYARGPEGEALEFVQALNPVKKLFDAAFTERQRSAGQ